MDSAKIILIVCSAIWTLTFFSGCVTSFAYDEDFPSDDYDILPVPIGKRSQNPFCRRCLIHRDEWMSCNLCYGRPRGIVPYFGKRSSSSLQDDFYQDDSDGDGRRISGDDMERRMVDKRARSGTRSGARNSFLDTRCCDALGIRECCRRSLGKREYRTILFPEEEEEEEDDQPWKREYETSLVPLDDSDGGVCSCCEGPLFDFSCCSMACTKRK